MGHDADINVAINAGTVQRRRDGLEEILVRDAGYAVLLSNLVGIVTSQVHPVWSAGNRPSLDVADFWIVLSGRLGVTEVVQLHVRVLLGKAKKVGKIVHAIVRYEELNDRRVNVGIRHRAASVNEDCRIAPLMVRTGSLPVIDPRENVLTHGTGRRIRCRGR